MSPGAGSSGMATPDVTRIRACGQPSWLMRGVVMDSIEKLREAVSVADASLRLLVSPDDDVRIDAVLDMASLLQAAKAVVLDA